MKVEKERRIEMESMQVLIMMIMGLVPLVISILLIVAIIRTWVHTSAIEKYLKAMNSERKAEAYAQLKAIKALISAIKGIPEE